MPHALAVDIGGSHVTAAVVDLQTRRILPESLTRRTTRIDDSANDLLSTWAGAAADAARAAHLLHVERVGVAIPGPFDYELGVSWHTQKFTALYGQNVAMAIRYFWQDTPLAHAPLRFANDAGLWALGEWWLAADESIHRLIGVTLGTGLGSGFVERGKIVSSGEDVPPGGEIWNTPYLDSIAENYAAAAALSRSYQSRGRKGLAPVEIAARAQAGDEHAREVYEQFGAHLAAIFAPWVARFKPDRFVVGGNIARAWDLFYPALHSGLPGITCLPTVQFESSGLLGAAALGEAES